MKNFKNKIKSFSEKVSIKVKKVVEVLAKPFQKVAATKTGQAVLRVVRIPFVGYLLLACFLNLFLETLSRHSLWKAFVFIGQSPLVYLYNAFIIFVTLSLVLFAKRKVFATIFVCIAWIISAFANYIVLCFRTTPFSAIDVLMIRNVMTMLDKYMTKWQMVLSAIGIVLVVALLVYLYVRLPKSESKRRPFRASAYVCMCLILIAIFTKVAVETQTISDNFGNLAYAYNDYGFAYCFSNSIIDVGISKPKDYSEETINSIVADLDYDRSEVILVTKEEAMELEKEKEASSQEEATVDSVLLEEYEEEQPEVIDNTMGEESEETESSENDTGNVEDASLQEDTENESVADASEESIEEDITQDNPDVLDIADGLPGPETEDTEGRQEAEEEIAYYSNEPATEEYPNIIVIQLESIFDVKYMKDFYPSQDPTPTLTKLKKKFSSGLFTVPAVGAGTANTEFEVQTGMSTQFFGAGEYPFKTVMRDVSCDSMGYDLKRQGYATAGFHNNDATFYERYVDYSNLGFDTFTGMEHMYHLNYTPRGWAKDDVLDDVMIERMLQTEGRDYITTITVQGHGRYPKKYTHTLTDITCRFEGQYAGDEEKRAAWTYYINMSRETDNMIASLLYRLEQLDEPTVVFMYGDHLPSLNLEESDLDGITLYQTEWVMWDNIGLEKRNKDMTAYQASTYIFNRLGLKGGLMQNFHNQYMAGIDEEDYLHKLELLEYDTLYGNNYAFGQFNPFPRTDMKQGIRDIVLKEYEVVDNRLYIYGDNFNEFSEAYVDGKSVKTRYVNAQTLSISLESAKKGTDLYIAQAGDDHVVLSVTDTIPLEVELPDTELSTEEEQTGEPEA